MHYKGFLITKNKLNEKEMSRILDKYYYENKDNKSGFTWDWWIVGGRYSEEEEYKNSKYEDLRNFDITDCYLVIQENYINIRERWDGAHFIENKNFDDEVKKIDLKNKFITVIDFHD